ncbi:MAG: DUF3810 domain-containing protein [Ferruginibacter sp.]
MLKGRWFSVVLLGICIFIYLFSLNSLRVENYYSLKFFPVIAEFLRLIFGWIRFSVGDFLYLSIVLYLIFKVIKNIKSLKKSKPNKKKILLKLEKAFKFLAIIYIVFNVFWGINYNRVGVSSQLNLKIEPVSKAEIIKLNYILIEKVNKSKLNASSVYPDNHLMFEQVNQAFQSASIKYPFLKYKYPSIKSSLWGWLGNYTGFTGYYNPFTGEAQINTLVPKFLHPYIACHEVAHQLGYAKEMEANFVGFLAAKSSDNPSFHYSVYLDLFTYANRSLYYVDTAQALALRDKLNDAVKTDISVWREFNRRHKNPVEPIIRWTYGKFLQSNNQPDGIYSYDQVITFMVAYYKKYGTGRN